MSDWEKMREATKVLCGVVLVIILFGALGFFGVWDIVLGWGGYGGQ